MNEQDPKPVTAAERRVDTRREAAGAVQVRIDTTTLAGEASNLSRSGILFFTEGELKVTVEIDDGDGPRAVTGSLVRSERIKGDRRSWAVEFDRD
jgi:hypothetical protein